MTRRPGRPGLPGLAAGERAGWLGLVVLCGLGQALAMGAGAFAMRAAFAALHDGQPVPGRALLALAAAGLAAAALRTAARVFSERAGQSYARDLRRVLYRHIAGMSARAVAARRAGGLGLRFVGDLAAMRGWIGRALPRLAAAAVIMPAAGATLWALDPALAAAAGAVVPAALLAMALAARSLGRLHAGLRRSRASLAAGMMERLVVAPELDALGRTSKELDGLGADSARLVQAALARARAAAALKAMPEIGTALAGVAVLWAGAEAGAAPADVAAALAVLGILLLPLRDLTGVWDRWQAWRIARAKCAELLAEPSTLRRPGQGAEPARLRVSGLRLPGGTASFVLEPGEIGVIAAPAGAGISTLLDILAGREPAPPGTVRIGGAAAEPTGDAAPRVALLRASGPILRGSLRRALTLGLSPRPKGRAVAAAAKRYGLGPLLARLGLDGRVGEAGRTLSETERFGVQCVRAALSRPGLLLIDTPVSGPAQERMIRRLVEDLGTTTLSAWPCRTLDRCKTVTLAFPPSARLSGSDQSETAGPAPSATEAPPARP